LHRNRLLRFGLEIAGRLRLLAHCLHRRHHVRLLVVIGVP
jgi:hypothetical protein